MAQLVEPIDGIVGDMSEGINNAGDQHIVEPRGLDGCAKDGPTLAIGPLRTAMPAGDEEIA